MKIGDQVRLKSGGPIMTIKAFIGQYALCTWPSGVNTNSCNFNLKCLDMVT